MINEPRQDYHPYDRALKSLMDDHAREMVPELLPGCEVEGEENVELNQTTLRADLVYNVRYQGQPRVLDLELQTQPESAMAYRMLVYHVALYGRYRKPVISLVLYPFETTIPEPVFEEQAGLGTKLEFQHSVLRVWELEAERYLRRRVACMYTLMPAMKGVSAAMLLQVIAEMERLYQGEDLRRHLVRFRTLLRRSKTLSEPEKQIVEERLQMYDSLLESDPYFQERLAREGEKVRQQAREEGLQQGLQQGLQEGLREGQQKNLIELIGLRFPALKELAQQRVPLFTTDDELLQLMQRIVMAPDEEAAQQALEQRGS
jgi:predicted transposase YdaD